MLALHRGLGLIGLASLSRDGELIARVTAAMGYQVLRGSNSRGAVELLLAARRALGAGGRPAFAVDGPRGPRLVPQPGARALARSARVPLVFGEVEARGVRLRTWDAFLVPWPFARVRVSYRVER
jgi:lysophospholipid acyltransferase (LPLAT)-like uncharacterized protein